MKTRNIIKVLGLIAYRYSDDEQEINQVTYIPGSNPKILLESSQGHQILLRV